MIRYKWTLSATRDPTRLRLCLLIDGALGRCGFLSPSLLRRWLVNVVPYLQSLAFTFLTQNASEIEHWESWYAGTPETSPEGE